MYEADSGGSRSTQLGESARRRIGPSAHSGPPDIPTGDPTLETVTP